MGIKQEKIYFVSQQKVHKSKENLHCAKSGTNLYIALINFMMNKRK